MRIRFCVAVLLLFAVSGRAQDEQNPDIRIFRSVNALQDTTKEGFFEYLDHTSIPTFGALPVGFAVVGLASKDRAVLQTGLLSLTAQATTLGITILLKEISYPGHGFSGPRSQA